MKILFISGDFSRHTVAETYHLVNELKKLAYVVEWFEPGNIHDILNRLDFVPDFVFVNEFGENNCPKLTGLESLTTIPFGIYVYDIHFNIEARRVAYRENNVKYIFSHYRNKFYEWYPEFSCNMRWLPQHVNTDMFYDYGIPKDIDYLLMGAAFESVYPLRCKIIERMKEKPGFVYIPHPGYRNIEEDERKSQKVFVREDFARMINRAKIFFTCDSVNKYPIAKYYEVLACKTLLLASPSHELFDLGFIPGKHFVPINEHDFEEKAEYYLHHDSERQEIAEQGYHMVRSRHSSAKRASELYAMIEEILVNHK